MTYIPVIETTSITLGNPNATADGIDPVVTLELVGNNEGLGAGRIGQRTARLHIGFKGSYPSEVEIEPGPECHPKGNIVSQIMQWGPRTKDMTKRGRVTTSIVTDSDGGLACVIDSSTNDPSGSEGQSHAMPLVFNVGEAKGQYIILRPDGRVKLFQGKAAYDTTLTKLIEILARNG